MNKFIVAFAALFMMVSFVSASEHDGASKELTPQQKSPDNMFDVAVGTFHTMFDVTGSAASAVTEGLPDVASAVENIPSQAAGNVPFLEGNAPNGLENSQGKDIRGGDNAGNDVVGERTGGPAIKAAE